MNKISESILSEILLYGYSVNTPSFLDDGRISGNEIRASYKEIMNSSLGIKLYEGEYENGRTLLIFVAANTGCGEVKKEVEYISSQLSTEEVNALFTLKG